MIDILDPKQTAEGFNTGNLGQLRSQKVPSHYHCYKKYCEAFGVQPGPQSLVDGRAPLLLEKGMPSPCFQCRNQIVPRKVLDGSCFIRNITTGLSDTPFKSQFNLECYRCISLYYERWIEEGLRTPTKFSLDMQMIGSPQLALRRHLYYKPDYSLIESRLLAKMPKSELDGSLMEDDDEKDLQQFSIPAQNLICHEDSQSDSNSASLLVEMRRDGRPKRERKAKMHYDEQYPPELQTPKRKKPSSKSILGRNSQSDTPLLMKKRSSVRRQKASKDNEEMNSDDEDYQKANKKIPEVKGRNSCIFLVRKYVNKIKF